MRVLAFPLAIALVLGPVPALSAQTGGKPTAILLTGPEVGRKAPDFTLPWANKEGVGPAENPYQLWRDRGKTVVLAFYSRDFTSSSATALRTFTEQYDSLFGPDVVLVAVSTDSLTTHQRFAARLGLPFRLLSDPEQQVARKYGSHGGGGYTRSTIFVIGPDGRVEYRNLRFDALDPEDYTELDAAIQAARGG